ncbi:MAG: Gfo/Idh/MocA family oxidoreductase [Clostridia bacterium]|nr:Gfo/Idh/MocA family oxidoreductase [Clostridia bacterium]
MKQLKVILIGAGGRGTTYVTQMKSMPEKYKVIGVADPIAEKRRVIKEMHDIPDEMCFETWEDLLALPKFADLVVIATSDDLHYAPAMKAISLGYDILLEKPVAQTVKECTDIANAAQEKDVSVVVCHVLRYTPFFKKVKSIIQSGMIGNVISIDQTEAVGNVHFSHSFVRGNWHSEKDTTPFILAKTCHDLDMIQWLIDKPCKKVTSFGRLTYFTEKNAPEGAPRVCIDGNCPHAKTCPYNSEKLYIEGPEGMPWKSIFRKQVATHPDFTDEELCEALKRTDYGLCVYHANNDVVDNQNVDMEFADGITAHLTVNAFNAGGRHIRIYGTKGELFAFASGKSIHVFTFEDRKEQNIPVTETNESITGGHGGGDFGIITDLYDYLTGTYTGDSVADIRISVANHLISFAAEEARHTDTVIQLDDYFAKNNYENL